MSNKYHAGIDISEDGTYITVTKQNDFRQVVVESGFLDKIGKKLRRYEFDTIAIDQRLSPEQLKEISKYVKGKKYASIE